LCYDVTVFIDQSNQGFSNDATENFNRLKEISGVVIKDFSEVSTVLFEPDSVIIDALFGSGLNRNIEGKLATLIHQLNQIESVKFL
jgi:NAD(P)H-hydrate epimerase